MQLFADLTCRAIVGVHLDTFKVLHGYFSSVRPVDQQRRQLAVRFYPRWCYVRSGVVVSARTIGSTMNSFYNKQTKLFGPKKFVFDFCVKVPKKIFVAQKIKLEDTLIFGREHSVLPNP